MRFLLPMAILLLLGGLLPASPPLPAAAAEEPDAAEEQARKHAIQGLRKKLRRLCLSPWADQKKDEVMKHLEALKALGGTEAGRAAMAAVPHTDEDVRKAAFDLIESQHDKTFVRPLAAMLEDKRYRRDFDAKRRIAHALAVVAHPSAIEPLTELIRFDEDAEVVAEAADALAGYANADLRFRKPAVKRLVDLYASTWNLKESVRSGHKDKILKKEAQERYKVYGKSLRHALQSLTGRQLTRPREWREWWNDNKKRRSWEQRRD